MKTYKANKILKLALSGFLLLIGPGVVGIVHAQQNVFNPGTSAVTPQQQQVEVGPVLDVVPCVLSDGFTINLTLIPSLTEFGGYDSAPTIPGINVENVVQVPTILPSFVVRQMVEWWAWENRSKFFKFLRLICS